MLAHQAATLDEWAALGWSDAVFHCVVDRWKTPPATPVKLSLVACVASLLEACRGGARSLRLARPLVFHDGWVDCL
jgi:hypothetical protein